MSIDTLQSLLERRVCADCVLKPVCRPALVQPDEIEAFAGVVIPRRPVAAGTRIYDQGRPLRSLFVSQRGMLKTEVLQPQGDAQVIGFHFPGELMGLEALSQGRHRASTVALEAALVCEIPLAVLDKVVAERPDVQHRLMKGLGDCLSRQQEHVEALAPKAADERIALFLFGLLERLESVAGQSLPGLSLPMGRSEIGSYLCLSMETVSRGFTRLRDDGIIAVSGRRIGILDRERLALRAHTSDGRRQAARP